MAIVRSMEKINPLKHSKTETHVYAEYCLLKDGFEVRTFGSENRQHRGKTSQVIYFKGEAALNQLREILSQLEDK